MGTRRLRKPPRRRTVPLLCAAALLATTARAAEPGGGRSTTRFKLYVALTYLGVGRASTDASLPVPSDWRARLNPPSSSMSTSTASSLFALGFGGLAVEPTLRFASGAEVAALVSYDDLFTGGPYGSCSLGYHVAGVTAYWWNPVTLATLRLRKPFPSIGAGVGNERWRLAVKLQRYELIEQQFEGVDCPGCPNYSRLIEEHTREQGWGQRYSVAWQPLFGHLRLEVIHERNGGQVRRWAFAMTVRVPVIGLFDPEPTASRAGSP